MLSLRSLKNIESFSFEWKYTNAKGAARRTKDVMEKQYTYNLTALSNVILHTQQYNLFLILIFFLSKFVFILLLLI